MVHEYAYKTYEYISKLAAVSARLEPSLSSSLYLRIVCIIMMCFWAN